MSSSSRGQPATDNPSHRWFAPEEDGGVLIWPEPSRLVEAARQNRARLDAAAHVQIGGEPLAKVRRAARGFVGQPDEALMFATGHQCELWHPGVWIKNALIASAADAADGWALHVAVDTDAPKHLRLRWPGFAAPITGDPRLNAAPWSGLLHAPAPAHLQQLLRAAESAQRDGLVSELLVQFLASCRSSSADQQGQQPQLSPMLCVAQQDTDWELGVRYDMLELSRLLNSHVWARFVLAIASDGRSFAGHYNASLAQARRQQRIESADRPASDLLVTRAHVELPFWLDDLAAGQRHRAELRFKDGQALLIAPDPALRGPEAMRRLSPMAQLVSTELVIDRSDVQSLHEWLLAHNLRLAPRALSLTLFLRLCVCDLFVHGIGGGLYDQVTDRIIRNYFGIEPPAFAVATATLYHPSAAGRQRVSLPRLRHQEHKLAHDVLGAGKQQWLKRIGEKSDPRARRDVFEAMHEARRRALATDPAHQAAQRRLEEAQRQEAIESEIFDRELFYAIQPAARLRELVGRVSAAVLPRA